jgi:hypothetical protein
MGRDCQLGLLPDTPNPGDGWDFHHEYAILPEPQCGIVAPLHCNNFGPVIDPVTGEIGNQRGRELLRECRACRKDKGNNVSHIDLSQWFASDYCHRLRP